MFKRIEIGIAIAAGAGAAAIRAYPLFSRY
jgi:hypothetical protein